MAYTPTADDINEFMQQDSGRDVAGASMPAPNQAGNGYVPSASDIYAMDPSLKPSPPFYKNIAADIVAPLATTGQDIANFFLPKKYQGQIDFPRLFGVNNPSALDKFLQTSASYLPYGVGAGEFVGAAAKGLPALGPLAARIGTAISGSPALASGISDFLGGTAFSAQNNPQNTALQNLGSGALMGSLSAPLGLAAAGLRAIRGIPMQDVASNIMKYLGRGDGIEENNSAIASLAQNELKNRKAVASSIYNPIFDKYGERSIYGTRYEGMSSQKVPVSVDQAGKSNFNALDDSEMQNIKSSTPALYKKFLENPSLNNAHLLQSDLGTTIRNMPLKLSSSDNVVKNSLINGRQALLSDMTDSFGSADKNAAAQYEKAKTYYYENVSPALHPDISSLTLGKVQNPSQSQVINTFRNPEPGVQKIIDENPELADRVLFSKLSNVRNIQDPYVMQKQIADLDRQGLSSSITPSASKMFNQLSNSIKRNNLISHIAGAVSGFALGKAVPVIGKHLKESAPIAGAILGSGIKNINPFSPEFLDKLNNSLAARGLKRAIGANIVGQQNNQEQPQ